MAESSLEFGKVHSGKRIDLMVETDSEEAGESIVGLYCRCSIFLSGTNTRIGDVAITRIKGEPKTGVLHVNILFALAVVLIAVFA